MDRGGGGVHGQGRRGSAWTGEEGEYMDRGGGGVHGQGRRGVHGQGRGVHGQGRRGVQGQNLGSAQSIGEKGFCVILGTR